MAGGGGRAGFVVAEQKNPLPAEKPTLARGTRNARDQRFRSRVSCKTILRCVCYLLNEQRQQEGKTTKGIGGVGRRCDPKAYNSRLFSLSLLVASPHLRGEEIARDRRVSGEQRGQEHAPVHGESFEQAEWAK